MNTLEPRDFRVRFRLNFEILNIRMTSSSLSRNGWMHAGRYRYVWEMEKGGNHENRGKFRKKKFF